MSRVIYKYDLDPAASVQCVIPKDSVFLDLQVQDGVPVMWWSVPKEKPWPPAAVDIRTFSICPTGGSGYTENLHYVGTFQLRGFVGHVMSWEPVPRAYE